MISPANSVAVGAPFCRVVCSLDEYYQKRKVKGLQEAVERMLGLFQKRIFGRDPFGLMNYMKEFIYFVDASKYVEEYERQGVPLFGLQLKL